MGKQKGPTFITGTFNGLCYYQMDGNYYVRRKSSLSRRRVKRSPAFKRTMRYAGLLAQASRIASEVYRITPRKSRKREIFHALTGKAMELLKKGLQADLVMEQLKAEYKPLTVAPVQKVEKPATAPVKVGSLSRTRKPGSPSPSLREAAKLCAQVATKQSPQGLPSLQSPPVSTHLNAYFSAPANTTPSFFAKSE